MPSQHFIQTLLSDVCSVLLSVHSSFVHRNGRTARMGQEGKALIMLTPSETCYVEFLRLNKGLTLQTYPTPNAPCMRDQARELLANDR